MYFVLFVFLCTLWLATKVYFDVFFETKFNLRAVIEMDINYIRHYYTHYLCKRTQQLAEIV